MRPVLLVLLAAAAPLAVRATTIATTSCTAGSITDTPCPGNMNLTTGLSGPNYFVSSFAQAIDTPTGNIVVTGGATAYYTVSGLPEPTLSATDTAVVNDIDYTSGPMRPGYIHIAETISSLHGLVSTTWSLTDGSLVYGGSPSLGQACLPGSSSGKGCSGSATLPFELGIPFQVMASASDGASISPGQTGYGSGDQVTLTFSLFEADGTTPVSFAPAPEPSQFALYLSGFLAVALLLRTSNRRMASR